MATPRYLTYYIVLDDAARVTALQAQYPNGVNRAIQHMSGGVVDGGAVVEFGAPFKGYDELALDAAPYIWTPWRADGSADNKPFPLDVATFSRHSGGFFGIGGTTVQYYWIGRFVYAANSTAASGSVNATFPRRRWVEGFELPNLEDAAGSERAFVRDASRHVGGFGLAWRAWQNASAAYLYLNSPAAAGVGDDLSRSWERFYLRLRALPATATTFWRCEALGGGGANVGVLLFITPSGQIQISERNAAGTIVPTATVSTPLTVWNGDPAVDGWVRLDLLIEYNTVGPTGGVYAKAYFRLLVNGTLVASIASQDASGTTPYFGDQVTEHYLSHFANAVGGANTLELDVDDWVNSELPTALQTPKAYAATTAYIAGDLVHDPATCHQYRCKVGHTGQPLTSTTYWERFESLDWQYGSKVISVKPNAFDASHSVNWTGDVRLLLQRGNPSGRTTPPGVLTSSTAVAEVVTDIDTPTLVAETGRAAMGAAAISVVSVSTSINGTTSRVGLTLGGVTSYQTSGGTGTYNTGRKAYTIPSATPHDLSGLLLRYEHRNDANSESLKELGAHVELVGVFGPQDVAPGATPPSFGRFPGHHNGPYPRSPWALDAVAAPAAPVMVHTGTYTGNGTGQDLYFRAPVHFLAVRPTSGATRLAGYQWHSTKLGAAYGWQDSVTAVLTCDQDPTFTPLQGEDAQQVRYRVRLAGSDAGVNANAVVYQFVAVSDPGARFVLNGTLAKRSTQNAVDTRLIDAAFTPQFVLAQPESAGATTGSTFARGPLGSTATSMCTLATGAALTNALALAAGTLTSYSGLHNVTNDTKQIAVSAWRTADGLGAGTVCAIGSYTGNGAASLAVALAPPTGLRPAFAMVWSETSVLVCRDPGHTSTNSTRMSDGVTITTGITAGAVDGFTVGSSLNSNTALYNYLVIYGSATAGNGGWSGNGEFFPLEMDTPATGPWPAALEPEEYEEEEEDDEDDGGDTAGGGGTPTPTPGTGDFDAACIVASTRIANVALSYIGISQQIGDLVTEQSREAATMRLHFGDAVDATLREFAWPFATRYAALTLVAGTETVAANRDWQYAYRAPTNMAQARRLVREGIGRGHDPSPPTFRVGSDDTGALIFTNEADVVLEYTLRLACPAVAGDALYREALAWRVARAVAPALTRDEKIALNAWAKYLDVLRTAETPAAAEAQEPPDEDAEWIKGR
jgi:hypothetical protein